MTPHGEVVKVNSNPATGSQELGVFDCLISNPIY